MSKNSDNPILSAFGKAVKYFRLEKGFSQEQLALECQLDRTYISGIERGIRNPSLINISKIATALKVRAADLLSEGEANG